MDSLILEVALGLAVTFATVAALSAVLTELVARFLGLRARFLLLGLRELLDGPSVLSASVQGPDTEDEQPSATAALLATPIMSTQGMVGSLTNREFTITKALNRPEQLAKIKLDCGRFRKVLLWVFRNPLRGLPSYVSAEAFSAGVFDMVVQDRDLDQPKSLAKLRQQIAAMNTYPILKTQLQSLLLGVEGDVGAFRTAVERWYDDHMDRVSGWYKRHVAKWSLAIGVVLVLALNVNTVTIAQTLFTDDAARAALTAVAASAADCEEQTPVGECVTSLQEQLSSARVAGLPIGWSVVAECANDGADCGFWARYGLIDRAEGWWDWQPVLRVLGLVLTVFALVPGARVWFDLLGRLGSLRTTGPRPAAPGSGR
jgi:hypothetical protein